MLARSIIRGLLATAGARSYCGGVVLKSLREMPTVRGLPLIGSAFSFLVSESPNRVHKYIEKRHREMGPILRESIGPVDAVFISDPDIMRTVFTKHEGKYPVHVVPDPWELYNNLKNRKRGLFFMHGEEWLHYRRKLNKLVLRPDTESWLKIPISESTNNSIENWKNKCQNGQFEPKMPDEMYKLSLSMMMSVVLGSAYRSSAHKLDELIGVFAYRVHKIFVHSARMVKLPAKYYMKFNFPAWKDFVKAVDDSMETGQELMEKVFKMDDLGDGLVSKLKEEKMTEEEITRIVMDFVMAAGDTTATTTQWALYLLCENPEVWEQYRSVINNPEEEIKFRRGIIKETLRIYPPAPFITRLLPEDSELGGYLVPAGTMVALSVYISSRDHRYFPDPMKFDPARWYKSEDTPGINAYSQASMPFAIGARSCIGRKIAMLQIGDLIKKISQNFDIKLMNKDIEDIMQMVIVPSEPFKFLFSDRQYIESTKLKNSVQTN